MRPEEVVDLTQRDYDSDTGGEARDDRGRQVAYQLADAAQRRNYKYRAGKESSGEHAGYAVLRGNRQQYRRHRAGRSGYLVGGSGEYSYHDTCNDRGHKSGGCVRTGADAECQSQRQRHRRNSKSSHQVLGQLLAVVAPELIFQVAYVLFKHCLPSFYSVCFFVCQTNNIILLFSTKVNQHYLHTFLHLPPGFW